MSDDIEPVLSQYKTFDGGEEEGQEEPEEKSESEPYLDVDSAMMGGCGILGGTLGDDGPAGAITGGGSGGGGPVRCIFNAVAVATIVVLAALIITLAWRWVMSRRDKGPGGAGGGVAGAAGGSATGASIAGDPSYEVRLDGPPGGLAWYVGGVPSRGPPPFWNGQFDSRGGRWGQDMRDPRDFRERHRDHNPDVPNGGAFVHIMA